WHPTEMNAPAEAFRFQALAKEIAAELRAKFDLNETVLNSRQGAWPHGSSFTARARRRGDRIAEPMSAIGT
ncbi:MAG: hypothetical protein WA730_23005, partial [Pseudolabrys sp.]